MNYRQWKKNYKKLHGVNPPLELDKRKQRRLAKKTFITISRIDISEVCTKFIADFRNAYASIMRGLGEAFGAAATVCMNMAEYATDSVEQEEKQC